MLCSEHFNNWMELETLNIFLVIITTAEVEASQIKFHTNNPIHNHIQ